MLDNFEDPVTPSKRWYHWIVLDFYTKFKENRSKILISNRAEFIYKNIKLKNTENVV